MVLSSDAAPAENPSGLLQGQQSTRDTSANPLHFPRLHLPTPHGEKSLGKAFHFFMCFLPAVSPQPLARMRERLRSWRLRQHAPLHFYPTELSKLFTYFDRTSRSLAPTEVQVAQKAPGTELAAAERHREAQPSSSIGRALATQRLGDKSRMMREYHVRFCEGLRLHNFFVG
jgi:hypothetical protein